MTSRGWSFLYLVPDEATGKTNFEDSNRGFADDSICVVAHIDSHGTSVENDFVAQG